MSITVITPIQLVTKDPQESRVYVVDWDYANLAAAVTIATSTFAITAIAPIGDTGLTKDNELKLTAAQATVALERTVSLDNRATRVRLIGGTLGALYEITNQIITSESPAQTKERSFRVLIEQQ